MFILKTRRYASCLSLLSLLSLVSCGDETEATFESKRNKGKISDPAIHSPFISRVGKSFIFDSFHNGNWDVLSCDLVSNQVSAIISGPLPEFHPILSPNSDTLAFVRQSNGFQHIWKISLAGNYQEQVTKGFVIDRPVRFVNGGSDLAFIRSVWPIAGLMPREALFVVSVSDRRSEPKTIGPGSTVAADLSVVAGVQYDRTKRSHVIWVKQRALGNEEKRIIGLGYEPALSQDGKNLAFVREGSKEFIYQLIVHDLATGAENAFPLPRGYLTGPVWDMDQQGILVRVPSSPRDGVGGFFRVALSNQVHHALGILPGEKLHGNRY
jgi:Tol biopolymer transport system component